jgi:tetratricopeptide (TPR) repeat protein
VFGCPRWRRDVAAGISVLALVLSAPAASEEIPCEFEAAERIVAIGDVHGAYDTFVELLSATGLVDRGLDWTGGTTHLVQTGDVLDRGPESRKVVELLMALEPRAEAAGGRVHALLGNHEFWNAVGALGYVSEKEFAAFAGRRDDALRKELGIDAPRGVLALREAYGAAGEYGRWLRKKNVAIRIGDVVFVHGGITPEAAALGLPELNRRVRADMDSAAWEESFSLSDDGPLMTRRYSSDDMKPSEMDALALELDGVLQKLRARLIVMGHTVTYGLVEPRFDGRAILIDTGMLDLYLGGRTAALVLEGEKRYAVYAGGRVEIPVGLDGEEGERYVESAFRASPGDRGLDHWMALVRSRQGRLEEAARLHESLGVFDAALPMPYAWRRDAAECFEAMGEREKSTTLYRLYLKVLEATARGMGPSGLPLLERYARECLRLGLEIEGAFEAARTLTTSAPENVSYKEALAAVYLEKGDALRAARVLELAMRLSEGRFELHLLLGRAQLALGRTEEAMGSFREAQRIRPGDREVEEAIRSLEEGVNR